MGACDFSVMAEGTSLEDAFSKAASEARYMYGHGGYSGTIAEKHDVVLIDTVASEREAYDLAEKLLGEDDERIDDKWGPAGAIKIAGGPPDRQQFLLFGWASS